MNHDRAAAPTGSDETGADELAADQRTERMLTWKGLLALLLVVIVVVARARWWV